MAVCVLHAGAASQIASLVSLHTADGHVAGAGAAIRLLVVVCHNYLAAIDGWVRIHVRVARPHVLVVAGVRISRAVGVHIVEVDLAVFVAVSAIGVTFDFRIPGIAIVKRPISYQAALRARSGCLRTRGSSAVGLARATRTG